MNLFGRARAYLEKRAIRRIIRDLRRAQEVDLLVRVEQGVLSVLKLAAAKIPAYADVLKCAGISVHEIGSLGEFTARVPVLDKERWFIQPYANLTAADRRDSVAAFFCSSGHTGRFSFGTETRSEQRRGGQFVEFAFQEAFGALDKKTLLINCLSMGVRAHTRSIPVAETSVREDTVLALVQKLSTDFEQFILLGEHLFLKLVVDEGCEQSVPVAWPELRIHVITGAEFVAENFRTYLASRMGINLDDPHGGTVNINYGLSEVSASIAHENWHSIQIRRLCQSHPEFLKLLCGSEYPVCPVIMQYYPSQVFMETFEAPSGRRELLVTVLDDQRLIPIIRYNTGDHALLLPYSRLRDVLSEFGRSELAPPLQLPVLLLWGKYSGLKNGSATVYPEQIKEAIYANVEDAVMLTGVFRLSCANNRYAVALQVRVGKVLSSQSQARLRGELEARVHVSMGVSFWSYEQFPYGKRNDFERKCRYID